jgi:AAA domain
VDEQTDVRSDRPSQDVEQGFNTQTPATEGHSKLAPVQPPITRIEVIVEDMPAVAAQAWAALRSVTDTNGRSQCIRVGNLACVRNEDGYEQLLAAALTSARSNSGLLQDAEGRRAEDRQAASMARGGHARDSCAGSGGGGVMMPPIEQAQGPEHTLPAILLSPTTTATDCGAVRAPLSIERAHTHTEPKSQTVEVRGAGAEEIQHTEGVFEPTDIEAAHYDRLLRLERTRRAVKRTLDAEEAKLTPMPPALSLTERFAMARPTVEYRVADWFVEGGHVLLVAQYKTGKTTLVGNLVRSLVDGDPFLDVAKARPVSGVVTLDFEMSEAQIESWLRDRNIRNTDRVHLVSLRGAASSFDILNPVRRLEWAAAPWACSSRCWTVCVPRWTHLP